LWCIGRAFTLTRPTAGHNNYNNSNNNSNSNNNIHIYIAAYGCSFRAWLHKDFRLYSVASATKQYISVTAQSGE